jgi:hypothetical protein
MPDEATPTPEVQIPEDFAAFTKWRETGKLPEAAAGGEPEKKTSEAPVKPAAETAPESETGNKEQETEEDDSPKGLKKRFHKLTSKIRDLEAKLAGQPAPQEAKTGAATPEPAKAEAKPKPDDFESYDDYQEALTNWTIDQREKTRQADESKRQATEQQKVQISAFQERCKVVRAQHEDFDETLEAAPAISAAMQQAIIESEQGAELAYELAKHPAEIERIAKLSPLAAAREIGKIEARLVKPAPEPEKPQVTRAPKPPTPVSARAAAEPSINDEKLSYAEWEKLRNAQLYK